MPVYVYRNLKTNETFEYEQRITEDALTVDPRTGDPVRRVIQPVGIAFKGSGFYVNDSRSGSSSARSKGSGDSSAGESSTSTASDAGSSAGAASGSGNASSAATASSAG